MWTSQLLQLLTGAALVLLGVRFSEGWGRRHRLARATRELEAASALDPSDPLVAKLQALAGSRLTRYVAEEDPHRRTELAYNRLRAAAAAMVVFLAAIGWVVLDLHGDSHWWLGMVVGVAAGSAGALTFEFGRWLGRRVIARRKAAAGD